MPSDVRELQFRRMSVWRAVQPPMPGKAKSVAEAFSKLFRQQQQLAKIKENISLSGSSLIAVPLTLR